MIGKEQVEELLSTVIKNAPCDALAMFSASDDGLTRFANNGIHQNTAGFSASVSFKAAVGKKLGVASTNLLDISELRNTLARAKTAAEVQPENPHFNGFAKPAEFSQVLTYIQGAEFAGPDFRSKAASEICSIAKDSGCIASGSVRSGISELAVATTEGLFCYTPISSVASNVIFSRDSKSGYAAMIGRDPGRLDAASLGLIARDKCLSGSERLHEIEPGEYEVILEAEAVAGLFEWLSYIGFGSKNFLDGTSFMAGRIGNKIIGDNITIVDDPTDPNCLPIPFDFEGVPKCRLPLIENGVAKNVCFDSMTAHEAGVKSTGHGLPPAANEGGMPMHLHIIPGNHSLDEMIASCQKAILITRFHYINGFLDPRNAVLTGMTRDGTFLVENGKITKAVRNLRFTQNMLQALSDVVMLGNKTKAVASWWEDTGATMAVDMKISRFKFTGVQQDTV